jgi:hypothetical protein
MAKSKFTPTPGIYRRWTHTLKVGAKVTGAATLLGIIAFFPLVIFFNITDDDFWARVVLYYAAIPCGVFLALLAVSAVIRYIWRGDS